MSSFAAELVVDGHTYPVRTCQYEFTQATGERGRPSAKVRHGRLQLSLDVPHDAVLTTWAATPYKPLSGHVTFFETDAQTARETVSFEAGQCIGYHESFRAGDQGAGAYICQLVIVAEKLVLQAGGATPPLTPAPVRDYVTAPAVVNSLVTASNVAIDSDCTESIRQSLQNQVKQNCKSGKQACAINDNCPVLETTMETLNACIAARTKINMKCFKGGDAGHKLQIAEKVNALVRCQGYYFSKCDRTQKIPASVPQRVPDSSPTKIPALPKEAVPTMATVGLFILYLITSALRPGPI